MSLTPWYCGACTRWNKRAHRFCPACGRPPKGRLCRSCKAQVSKGAAHCTHCGSRRLSEPGMATLPFSVPIRLAILASFLLVAAGLLLLLWPVVVALGRWLHGLLIQLLTLLLVFWLVTGLLPAGVGSHVRSGVWKALAFLWRFLLNLFR